MQGCSILVFAVLACILIIQWCSVGVHSERGVSDSAATLSAPYARNSHRRLCCSSSSETNLASIPSDIRVVLCAKCESTYSSSLLRFALNMPLM